MWQRINHLPGQDIQMSEFVNFELLQNLNIPIHFAQVGQPQMVYSIPEGSYRDEYKINNNPWMNDLSNRWGDKLEAYDSDKWVNNQERWPQNSTQQHYTTHTGAWVTFNQL